MQAILAEPILLRERDPWSKMAERIHALVPDVIVYLVEPHGKNLQPGFHEVRWLSIEPKQPANSNIQKIADALRPMLGKHFQRLIVLESETRVPFGNRSVSHTRGNGTEMVRFIKPVVQPPAAFETAVEVADLMSANLSAVSAGGDLDVLFINTQAPVHRPWAYAVLTTRLINGMWRERMKYFYPYTPLLVIVYLKHWPPVSPASPKSE